MLHFHPAAATHSCWGGVFQPQGNAGTLPSSLPFAANASTEQNYCVFYLGGLVGGESQAEQDQDRNTILRLAEAVHVHTYSHVLGMKAWCQRAVIRLLVGFRAAESPH